MKFRIKKVAKEKNITLADVAKKIGINPITLSQSLNGNPTINRLNEVADALGCDVAELFEKEHKKIMGCIFIDDEPHVIKSAEDYLALAPEIKAMVGKSK